MERTGSGKTCKGNGWFADVEMHLVQKHSFDSTTEPHLLPACVKGRIEFKTDGVGKSKI